MKLKIINYSSYVLKMVKKGVEIVKIKNRWKDRWNIDSNSQLK
jgi:hypothetical protein